jgi:hypothetical protein
MLTLVPILSVASLIGSLIIITHMDSVASKSLISLAPGLHLDKMRKTLNFLLETRNPLVIK